MFFSLKIDFVIMVRPVRTSRVKSSSGEVQPKTRTSAGVQRPTKAYSVEKVIDKR